MSVIREILMGIREILIGKLWALLEWLEPDDVLKTQILINTLEWVKTKQQRIKEGF